MKNQNITKAPPLILGAVIIFWGWQTSLLFPAIVMAVILESPRLVKFRWEFSLSDFSRISDLCALLFISMVVYLFFSQRSVFIIFTLLEWLPVSFFPLLFCQNYSTDEKIDIRAISMFFRRQKKIGQEIPPLVFNLSYPYFFLCILSASFANIREPGFYIGMLFLSAAALWNIRPKQCSLILWLSLFILVSIGGYAGHIGLNRLQHILEVKGIEWFYNLERKDADPYKSITAMGEIGKIKLSDQILFRVKPETEIELPLLLREASYNHYNHSRWFARYSSFTPLEPEMDGTSWKIGPESKSRNHIRVSASLNKGAGMLKLPTGAFKIRDLPVLTMEKNLFGAVKVKQGPGLAAYDVAFSSKSIDGPPDEDDLYIPEIERAAIFKIIEELKLKDKAPEEVLKTTAAFFQNNFNYSLELKPKYTPTPLAYFLLKSKTGHCEYFASATVLLLRAAGIPARYATGFSVHEFSRLENQLVVRERHAHAWTLTFVNGEWQDVDNTPFSWQAAEAETASSLQFIFDFCSWIKFMFSRWQWLEDNRKISDYMVWLLIPLFIILGRRLYLKKRVSSIREDSESQQNKKFIPYGTDSPFYRIEKHLTHMGFTRHPGEPFYQWIKGIEKEGEDLKTALTPLYPLLEIHYQCRFDPQGISQEKKESLNAGVEKWLDSVSSYQ